VSERDDRAFEQWLQVLRTKPWKARKLDALFPDEPGFVLRLRQALDASPPDNGRPAVTGRPRKSGADGAAGLPRDTVVGCRVDAIDLQTIDLLVEAGIRPTRSDAAAWFIHQGIQANVALVEEVRGTVAEIRRLRQRALARAQERDDLVSPPCPPSPPASLEGGDGDGRGV
jgi:hypothetical protein